VKTRTSVLQRGAETAAAEARVASRLLAPLNRQPLAHDVEQRLRVARQQAVARASERRRRAIAVAAGGIWAVGAGRSAAAVRSAPSGPGGWLQRIGTVLPLLALLGGLYGIDQWSLRESVLAAAEVDALLLADDLPPAAYTDPGFSEFLRSPAE
jgi:hypothetical protein